MSRSGKPAVGSCAVCLLVFAQHPYEHGRNGARRRSRPLAGLRLPRPGPTRRPCASAGTCPLHRAAGRLSRPSRTRASSSLSTPSAAAGSPARSASSTASGPARHPVRSPTRTRPSGKGTRRWWTRGRGRWGSRGGDIGERTALNSPAVSGCCRSPSRYAWSSASQNSPLCPRPQHSRRPAG